jgi:hypothetical protein
VSCYSTASTIFSFPFSLPTLSTSPPSFPYRGNPLFLYIMRLTAFFTFVLPFVFCLPTHEFKRLNLRIPYMVFLAVNEYNPLWYTIYGISLSFAYATGSGIPSLVASFSTHNPWYSFTFRIFFRLIPAPRHGILDTCAFLVPVPCPRTHRGTGSFPENYRGIFVWRM